MKTFLIAAVSASAAVALHGGDMHKLVDSIYDALTPEERVAQICAAHAAPSAVCLVLSRRHACMEPCAPPSGGGACAHEDGDIRAVAADLPRAPRDLRQLRGGRPADESPRRDRSPGEVARLTHDRRI